MSKPSPYEILGVERGASAEQIRRAYRAKAKALHPDVNRAKDAAELFARLQRAYELLSDPEARMGVEAETTPHEPGEAHFTWSNIAGRSRRRKGADRDDPHDFEELYRAFFQTRIDSGVGSEGSSGRGAGASRSRKK